MDPLTQLLRSLDGAGVRFVVIGVAGANYHALGRQNLFATQDHDLFLPLDVQNALSAWKVCRDLGLLLSCNDEPLGEPFDSWLAERVVAHRATVRADGPDGLQVDLTFTMAGFEFEQVWAARQVFAVEGVDIPVASFEHIIESKRLAGRDKDLLFLEAHRKILSEMLGERPEDDPE